VLGVDETRRGKAHYETDPTTGEKTWVDRFDTGLGACQMVCVGTAIGC
jgi:hypothetical protein